MPLQAPVAALLGSGISALTNLWNRKSQKKQADKNVQDTIAHQKAESQLAYDRELEMWEKTNQYNSPEQQMQRFKAAGLNPNLIYGKAAGGGNAAPATLPKYQAATGDYSGRMAMQIPDTSDVLNKYYDYQRKGLENEKRQFDKDYMWRLERGFLTDRRETEWYNNWDKKQASLGAKVRDELLKDPEMKLNSVQLGQLEAYNAQIADYQNKQAVKDGSVAQASITQRNAELKKLGINPAADTTMQILATELLVNQTNMSNKAKIRMLMAAGLTKDIAKQLLNRIRVAGFSQRGTPTNKPGLQYQTPKDRGKNNESWNKHYKKFN